MVYLVTSSGRDSDLRQGADQVRKKINYKGLLAVNPDRTVDHPKVAYRAVQHVTAVFVIFLPDYGAAPPPAHGLGIQGLAAVGAAVLNRPLVLRRLLGKQPVR